MAGVPFDVLDHLRTPDTIAAARELFVKREEFAGAKLNAERLLRRRDHGLSEELFRAWRKTIRTGGMPPPGDPPPRAFALCWECASNLATAEAHLNETLPHELETARLALLTAAGTFLPPYLTFVAAGPRERLSKQSSHPMGALPRRKKQDRAHERHVLLYLQRVCAKNDSLSEFGPEAWGAIEGQGRILQLAPEPGIAKREVFLERWTAHGVAAALNSDPAIRVELSPRLNPNGRIDGDQFVLTDSAETILLDQKTVGILRRCNGATAAYLFGEEIGVLEQLAALNMIRWEIEVPALDPHAFDTIVSDIRAWRDGPVRARWLEVIEPIAALPAKFAQATGTSARAEIMDEARRQLQDLGATRTIASRFLYSASNPIGEECFRECHFSIGEDLINEVVTDAEPWIDLWRDSYAFVASRVAAGLRALLEKAPPDNGVLPLPAFLRHCETLKMPLTGPAMVGLAHLAFQEVKAAFRERMKGRPETAEWELTVDDCHFVRENFQYDRFDEFTYPSADLQIASKSAEAVERGEYQWTLAELHSPVALLHHGFYWSCPDKEELGRALASTVKGCPGVHFGFSAADFTATTAVRMLDAMPEQMRFVASQRGDSRWRIIPPAEIEVFVDSASGDVGLRMRGSQEYLGSFARAWLISLGFHPFHFGRAPHMPRLRCGRVIVQRRSWTVTVDELPPGNYTGISRDLALAIERLRAVKDWPRYVYIRPSERALRRSGAEGRDKDTKPVFIDLESYLFLEIFHRWLTKAGELEITEMLPDPDHLLWREADGRRTFELRTQIVPRA
ncbi:MAG TPA: hypothetical protein VNP98_02295 [Chthoniobacterales bacterium]|nr:hypothetical protein [Chthoniobacterales bacterium]